MINQYFDTGETRTQAMGRWRLSRRNKEWVAAKKHTYKIDLEVVTPKGKGFQLVKFRGTFAWLFNFDYQRIMKTSEAFIHIVMIYLLINRLA